MIGGKGREGMGGRGRSRFRAAKWLLSRRAEVEDGRRGGKW